MSNLLTRLQRLEAAQPDPAEREGEIGRLWLRTLNDAELEAALQVYAAVAEANDAYARSQGIDVTTLTDDQLLRVIGAAQEASVDGKPYSELDA